VAGNRRKQQGQDSCEKAVKEMDLLNFKGNASSTNANMDLRGKLGGRPQQYIWIAQKISQIGIKWQPIDFVSINDINMLSLFTFNFNKL
jgi:hypothetical protein